MRQYDVFPNPRRALRNERPYLLILQHDRFHWTSGVVVAPLVPPVIVGKGSRLMPELQVLGAPFMVAPHDIATAPRSRFSVEAIDNLEAFRYQIMSALDHVFSAAG